VLIPFVLRNMFNWNPFGDDSRRSESRPLKIFPISFEAGIPLRHQPINPLLRIFSDLLLEPLRHRGLDGYIPPEPAAPWWWAEHTEFTYKQVRAVCSVTRAPRPGHCGPRGCQATPWHPSPCTDAFSEWRHEGPRGIHNNSLRWRHGIW
jgi:hypothetical protein